MNEANLYREQYYRLLGKFIVKFSELESSVRFYILRNLVPINDSATMSGIISHLLFEDKLMILRTLVFKKYSTEQSKEFDLVFNKIKQIQELRNDYMHSEWHMNSDEIEEDVMKFNQKKRFRSRSKNLHDQLKETFVSRTDLKNAIKDIESARKDLFIFFDKVNLPKLDA